MKKIFILYCYALLVSGCGENKQILNFTNLSENELSQLPFNLPNDKSFDSVRQIHNKCMGVNFDPNATLFHKNSSFFVGTIINKKSGQVVATTADLGLTMDDIASKFSLVTTPCYTKHAFNLPIKSILGDSFAIEIPGENKKLVEELNASVQHSSYSEIEAGSWIYFDMADVLKKMIDSGKSESIAKYKNALLETANVLLIASENIMNIRIKVASQNNLSESLLKLLIAKPSANLPTFKSLVKTQVKLHYITSNEFEIYIDGFFPIIGQFVKAKL